VECVLDILSSVQRTGQEDLPLARLTPRSRALPIRLLPLRHLVLSISRRLGLNAIRQEEESRRAQIEHGKPPPIPLRHLCSGQCDQQAILPKVLDHQPQVAGHEHEAHQVAEAEEGRRLGVPGGEGGDARLRVHGVGVLVLLRLALIEGSVLWCIGDAVDVGRGRGIGVRIELDVRPIGDAVGRGPVPAVARGVPVLLGMLLLLMLGLLLLLPSRPSSRHGGQFGGVVSLADEITGVQ
jgi:hypothetical protein